MSQHTALSSLFGDDPFFSQEQLLWPLSLGALSSLQQDFFSQRAKLADSLLKELHDGPQLLKLKHRFSEDGEQQRELPTTEEHRDVQQANGNNGDLLVTLDARGYAPSDITVKLEGRRLAVAAMKQAGAEESKSCSSSSSCASFCSSALSQAGFAQSIELPPHLDLSGLSCSLMDDGQLRIHAPVAERAAAEEEPQEPARFRTSLEFPIRKDETEEEEGD